MGPLRCRPRAHERFRREAAAARRITHPKAVRLHDIGVDRGIRFPSMEYVCGESLRQRRDREALPPLSEYRDVPMAWQLFVARALAKTPAGRLASASEMHAALPSA